MNDAELIAQFRAGQIAAFNTLVKRWECPIYNFVLRYVGNRDDARSFSSHKRAIYFRAIGTNEKQTRMTDSTHSKPRS